MQSRYDRPKLLPCVRERERRFHRSASQFTLKLGNRGSSYQRQSIDVETQDRPAQLQELVPSQAEEPTRCRFIGLMIESAYFRQHRDVKIQRLRGRERLHERLIFWIIVTSLLSHPPQCVMKLLPCFFIGRICFNSLNRIVPGNLPVAPMLSKRSFTQQRLDEGCWPYFRRGGVECGTTKQYQ